MGPGGPLIALLVGGLLGGVAGGTAVARSAWSETSFPFLLMLPRGPKEAYLRAPLPPTRRPAGRPVGGGRLHRFPRSAESGRRGVREGVREGAVSPNFGHRRLFSAARAASVSSLTSSPRRWCPSARLAGMTGCRRCRSRRHSIPFHSDVKREKRRCRRRTDGGTEGRRAGRQEEGKGETRRSDCLSEWWEFAGGKDGRRSPPGASAIAFSRRNRLVWYGENAKCNGGRFRL